MIDPRGLWQRALSPDKGFRLLAHEGPRLLPSLGGLLALRVPVAVLEILLTYLGLDRMYQTVISMKGPVWDLILLRLPPDFNVADLRYLLQDLPPMPTFGKVLPWVLLAAPLYVLSLWFHDAVWDHGCLWLLGGLSSKHGFNTTLIAESEALQVGVFGAFVGLLTSLPGVGWGFSMVSVMVGVYFWVLRGVALAAFHDCATWKGVMATVLHAAIAACFVFGTLLLLVVLLAQGLA